jgi:hypothetical protein
MGRVCRGPHGPRNLQNQYHLYLNCNLFLLILMQIKQEQSTKECSIPQLNNLIRDVLVLVRIDVAGFPFEPTRCKLLSDFVN